MNFPLKLIFLIFLLIFFLGCIQPKAICGNSKIEIGEECDNSPCPENKVCINCKCIIPIPPSIPPSAFSKTDYLTSYNTEFLRSTNRSNYVITIKIYKGWNLIPSSYGYILKNGTKIEDIVGYSEIDEKDFIVSYFFDPEKQKYMNLALEDLGKKLKSNSKLESYVRSSSVWVYSKKSGKMRYYLYNPQFMPKLGEIHLYKGWNFIHITPQMVGLSFDEIKGDCIVLGLYDWIEKEQKWSKGITRTNVRFKSENIGNTMIIKVKEECTLNLLLPV